MPDNMYIFCTNQGQLPEFDAINWCGTTHFDSEDD